MSNRPEIQPISSAPDSKRIMVCGWEPKNGKVDGYWWFEEDSVFGGKAVKHRSATHWFPIILPIFPDGHGYPQEYEGDGRINDPLKIEILVLVGSNGKATATVRGDMGWGDLADGIMGYEDGKWSDPDFTDRYSVNIEVPIPVSRELSAPALVEKVEG